MGDAADVTPGQFDHVPAKLLAEFHIHVPAGITMRLASGRQN
jgi:hypothetical protein